jgi:hypothetical protein
MQLTSPKLVSIPTGFYSVKIIAVIKIYILRSIAICFISRATKIILRSLDATDTKKIIILIYCSLQQLNSF